jgi:H+/Cl- antiporter ClcA
MENENYPKKKLNIVQKSIIKKKVNNNLFGQRVQEAYEIHRKPLKMLFLGAMVGVGAGGITSLYRYILIWAEDTSFDFYGLVRKNLPWIPLFFLAVMAVGFLASLIVYKNQMSAGSGIPQVKAVISGYFKDKWYKTMLAKIFGGALAILGGLSLGREGPSIQLGATAADGIGKRLTKSRAERKILIAAGASAGLSAAFNAPLAGVIFAFEEIFGYLSPATMLATTVAAVIADYISLGFFEGTVFEFQVAESVALSQYWTLLVLGVVTGLAGAFYNFALVKTQKTYNKIFAKLKMFKPMPVFALAFVVGIIFPVILAGGHAVLENFIPEKTLLLILGITVAKFVFSVISFSSGVPGGIFFPLLIIGGGIGAVYAKTLLLTGQIDSTLFYHLIILAMAGFFSSIVRAPITGIILLSEMTGNFDHFLPLSLVCVISYVTAEVVKSKPIYDSLLENLLDKKIPDSEIDVGTIMITEYVKIGSQIENKILKDISFPKDVLIVSIERLGEHITPNGNTILRAGDRLQILCKEADSHIAREICE